MMSSREILETAQSPNSSFPFLFDFGLGLGTWTRACQFNNVKFNIIVELLSSQVATNLVVSLTTQIQYNHPIVPFSWYYLQLLTSEVGLGLP